MKRKRTGSIRKRALFADLGYQPHDGQQEIHADRHRIRVVACGTRWGKTHCAAMEALAAGLAPREDSIGWIVAPNYDLATRVFRLVMRMAQEHVPELLITAQENKGRLVIRNMAGGLSEIRIKSAESRNSLLGEGLDWVILDEAARLRPVIWHSYLSQRLIDKGGWALLISTPYGKGYFYEFYVRGQGADPEVRSWNYPTWSNPRLPTDWLEGERRRLPERVFQQEYGASFIEGVGAVFRKVQEAATGALAEPETPGRYFAGLDLARVEDYTVLIVLNRKGQVVAFDRFTRMDWDDQVARIKRQTDLYNRASVMFDGTGVGDVVRKDLKSAGIKSSAYLFSAESKSKLINNLALRIEKGEIELPTRRECPELIEELEAFEYTRTEAGHLKMAAPYGTHDDCVIALALAAWGWNRGTRVSLVGAAPRVVYGDDNSPWLWSGY